MATHTTGVFYHPSFSRRSYLTVGSRLADFPRSLDAILKTDEIKLYEPEPVSRELLLKIHTPGLLERVGKGICFCGTNYESPDGTKVDVACPRPFESGENGRSMNDVYFDLVARHAPHRIRRFEPNLLFWYFGFDTHEGDYVDIGLTGPRYWNIANLMRELAEEVCGGKLEVVFGRGSQRHLATILIPPIIERLAGL